MPLARPLSGVLFAFCLFAPLAVEAQPLVYQPRNPAFGGNPVNYSWMLSSATSQNDYEQQRSSALTRDPLADFQQNLQRQILSQLDRELITSRFGGIDLTRAGRFDFGDFSIEITPGLSEVTITIFNLLTGTETTVVIPAFP